jgi:hypothetical protein
MTDSLALPTKQPSAIARTILAKSWQFSVREQYRLRINLQVEFSKAVTTWHVSVLTATSLTFSATFSWCFLPNLRAVPDVDISCIAAFSAVETAPVGRLKTG